MKRRLRSARPSVIEAVLKVTPISTVVTRRLSGAIALPKGLDTRNGRVLPRRLVPEAGVLALPRRSPLAVRPTRPTALKPRLAYKPSIRLPRQTTSRSRTPIPRALTRIWGPQELPARRQLEPTLRRPRLGMGLAGQRRVKPPVMKHALSAGLSPRLVPAGVAPLAPAIKRRPPVGCPRNTSGAFTQAPTEVTKRPLLVAMEVPCPTKAP